MDVSYTRQPTIVGVLIPKHKYRQIPPTIVGWKAKSATLYMFYHLFERS
jgi:hypothetical protein